ncbi:MAG: SGNH/GDSL hydrolase family protein [Candidatus Omnitrophica bacterium]|nr:SGNH/GDSL hydrolase family protein [Candidatus Omnitrophota bacterium]
MPKSAVRRFFIGCFGILLVGELALRVFNLWSGRYSDTMFAVMEHDDVLGWKMKPGIRKAIDLGDVRGIPVRSNSLGFWDEEFPLEKPVHRCRVAFLGDSFTWGGGVRQEERFTDLLKSAMPEWEVLNFGVPGYGTDQALLAWERITCRYRPDLVVLTVHSSDYLENMFAVRYGRPKPYFEFTREGKLDLKNVPVKNTDFWDDGIFNQAAPPYAPFFDRRTERQSRILRWLVKHSQMAGLASLAFQRSIGNGLRPNPGRGDGSNLSPAEEKQVQLLNALVNRLAEEVREGEGAFMVVFSGGESPQYRLQKKLFASSRVTWLDATTEALAEQMRPERDPIYFRYNNHWTPKAHRAVAGLLVKAIRQKVKPCAGL